MIHIYRSGLHPLSVAAISRKGFCPTSLANKWADPRPKILTCRIPLAIALPLGLPTHLVHLVAVHLFGCCDPPRLLKPLSVANPSEYLHHIHANPAH